MSSPTAYLPALLAVLLAAALFPSQAAAAKHECRGADTVVTAQSRAQAERTIRCLITRERTARGLAGLRPQRHLRFAGQRFARTLVRKGVFAHTVPGHPDLSGRLRAAGYHFSRAGENLASASGRLATPRRIVRSWMRSSGHRANMLGSQYRDIGIGIAIGTPGKGKGITVASEFGRRR